MLNKSIDNVSESENNIADLNETCKIVRSAIRKTLTNVDDSEMGEILICRKHINLSIGKVKLQVNLTYTIVNRERELYISNYNNWRSSQRR